MYGAYHCIQTHFYTIKSILKQSYIIQKRGLKMNFYTIKSILKNVSAIIDNVT